MLREALQSAVNGLSGTLGEAGIQKVESAPVGDTAEIGCCIQLGLLCLASKLRSLGSL